MKYTSYTWRSDQLVRTAYRAIKRNPDAVQNGKAFLKSSRRMKGDRRRDYIRNFLLTQEFALRLVAMQEALGDGSPDYSRMQGEAKLTLHQIAMEHTFRSFRGESWYPESADLVRILGDVEFNAKPWQLFDGQPRSVMIHLPQDLELKGGGQPHSMLVSVQDDRQVCESITKTVDDLTINRVVPFGCHDHEGHVGAPTISVAMCTKELFRVCEYPLERVHELANGNYELECITEQEGPITPRFSAGWVPSAKFTEAEESLTWDHLNLAVRLMTYAAAFPEVLVEMERPASSDVDRGARKVRLAEHPRIKKDPNSVRFVVYRTGYEKRAHEKTLRSPRFKRNPDGSPRVVPVKACWVPPVGYIGSRKMSVQELEKSQMARLKSEGVG